MIHAHSITAACRPASWRVDNPSLQPVLRKGSPKARHLHAWSPILRSNQCIALSTTLPLALPLRAVSAGVRIFQTALRTGTWPQDAWRWPLTYGEILHRSCYTWIRMTACYLPFCSRTNVVVAVELNLWVRLLRLSSSCTLRSRRSRTRLKRVRHLAYHEIRTTAYARLLRLILTIRIRRRTLQDTPTLWATAQVCDQHR